MVSMCVCTTNSNVCQSTYMLHTVATDDICMLSPDPLVTGVRKLRKRIDHLPCSEDRCKSAYLRPSSLQDGLNPITTLRSWSTYRYSLPSTIIFFAFVQKRGVLHLRTEPVAATANHCAAKRGRGEVLEVQM
jgi:hypothetical protein